MGMIINAIRGIHVLVPRNMTKAGFYNSLLECDEPALVIECLNGYRLKEKSHSIMVNSRPNRCCWNDERRCWYYLVSYGSTLRLIEQAAQELLEVGIDCEIIDVQSLLPFDINHDLVKVLPKQVDY
jgi:pyruvate/2-oxoglutarate/acetoin dehydrogenase E1 component